MIFTVRDRNIVITPAHVVPRDQAWFWTQEWRAREAEADVELAAGNGVVYENDEEFLAAIKAA